MLNPGSISIQGFFWPGLNQIRPDPPRSAQIHTGPFSHSIILTYTHRQHYPHIHTQAAFLKNPADGTPSRAQAALCRKAARSVVIDRPPTGPFWIGPIQSQQSLDWDWDWDFDCEGNGMLLVPIPVR